MGSPHVLRAELRGHDEDVSFSIIRVRTAYMQI